MRKISLTEKLILYFLFTGLFSIACVSWFAFQSGRKAIINRTFDQLSSVRVVKQNLVENYFREAGIKFELYSHPDLIAFLSKPLPYLNKDMLKSSFSESFAEESFFNQSLMKNDKIRAFHYLTKSDQYLTIRKNNRSNSFEVLINSNANSTDGIFRKFQVEMDSIDHMAIEWGGGQVIYFLKKIHQSSVERGVLIMEYDLGSIITLMVEDGLSSGWGITGESYIINENLLMVTPSRFFGDSIKHTVVNTVASRKASEGQAGTAIIKDYRAIKVLSSFCRLNIDGLNWAILVEIDYDEAMSPVNRLRNEILFLSIFIATFVFLLALYFSRSISKPILKLKVAANQIREGNFNVEVKIDAENEIGELTRDFNSMAGQIRQQMRTTITAQDDERQRLSKELHDGLGQMLVAASYKLQSVDCSSSLKAIEHINDSKFMVDQIIDEMRRISNNLMPGVLREFGLEMAVKSLIREASEISEISFNLNIENVKSDLKPDIQIYLFRIIQEATNNIIRHSKAKSASIKIMQESEHLFISISDDGIGFNMNDGEYKGGNGLRNMRERIAILGGSIQIESSEDTGTGITIKVPLI